METKGQRNLVCLLITSFQISTLWYRYYLLNLHSQKSHYLEFCQSFCQREKRTSEDPAQQIPSWEEIHVIYTLNSLASNSHVVLPMCSEDRETRCWWTTLMLSYVSHCFVDKAKCFGLHNMIPIYAKNLKGYICMYIYINISRIIYPSKKSYQATQDISRLCFILWFLKKFLVKIFFFKGEKKEKKKDPRQRKKS